MEGNKVNWMTQQYPPILLSGMLSIYLTFYLDSWLFPCHGFLQVRNTCGRRLLTRLTRTPASQYPSLVQSRPLSVGWTYWFASNVQNTQKWCGITFVIRWQKALTFILLGFLSLDRSAYLLWWKGQPGKGLRVPCGYQPAKNQGPQSNCQWGTGSCNNQSELRNRFCPSWALR